MYILGISISHDSSTCLLSDGEIVFYQEDERLTKIKHNVIGYRRPDPFPYYQSPLVKKYTDFIDYIVFSSFGNDPENQRIVSTILDKLKSEGISWDKVYLNEGEHHLYHASNAAFSSGFDKCACLIVDGIGASIEYEEKNFKEIESIYSFNYTDGFETKFKHYSTLGYGSHLDLDIKKIDEYELVFSDSLGCGFLFNCFSDILGYGGGAGAGKIMGLSSYGKNLEKYDNWFFDIDGVEINNNNLIFALFKKLRSHDSRYLTAEQKQEQQDILKTLQEQTKQHTTHLIRKALKKCNTNNIVLSGGYFLNCVNNYLYLKEFPEVNFYVDPIAHDGGTSIGAAKFLWWDLTKDSTVRKLDSLYLGEYL